jgi:hypothetical protein
MNCELMLTYDTPAYMFNVYKNQPSRQNKRVNNNNQNQQKNSIKQVNSLQGIQPRIGIFISIL